jgi:hypothetical protein
MVSCSYHHYSSNDRSGIDWWCWGKYRWLKNVCAYAYLNASLVLDLALNVCLGSSLNLIMFVALGLVGVLGIVSNESRACDGRPSPQLRLGV